MMRHKKSCPTASLSSSFASICPPYSNAPCIVPTPSSSAAVLPSGSKRTSCKWVPRFLHLGKLSMEPDDGFLLQQQALEGVLYMDGKFAEEKPKKELRFAAKIAVAMDADGFIGVKNCVCTDDALVEVKHKVNDTQYCVPSPSSSSLQRTERPSLKQARPLRRRRQWKLCRRIRRTRVLFACLFRKMTKALASSSKRTLGAQGKFIK